MTCQALTPSTGPCLPFPSCAQATDQLEKRTFFDLPRAVRDTIYSYALHSEAPHRFNTWNNHTDPYVPYKHIGLLCASQCVYEEASAVLYETVHLGSNALKALAYLKYIGPDRIRQIRNLAVSYQCVGSCQTTYDRTQGLDWGPVFGLLWDSWACVRHVEVDFDMNCVQWNTIYNAHGDETEVGEACELLWGEEDDSFWCGLRSFTMAKEINLGYSVPEYFIHHHARELCWRMEGGVSGDYRDGAWPNSEFHGSLINPQYPHQFDWLLHVHKRISQGIDVSGMTYDANDDSWRDTDDTITAATCTQAPGQANNTKLVVARSKKSLLDLPFEIRHAIYDYASEWLERAHWPEHPKRWNSGVDLLCTCKQIAREALPSVYRNFRLDGCSALDALTRLGPKVSLLRRLELHFTCFCPCDQDGMRRKISNRTIYAQELEHNMASSDTANFMYPKKEVIQRYMNMWSEAMARIQHQPRIKELEVTFASCCRYKPRRYGAGWTWEITAISKSRCLALETHFLDLLTSCRQLEKLSLIGDVPPSLATRMQQASVSLTTKWISLYMSAFITVTEAERAAWDSEAHVLTEWENTRPYPQTPYPTPDPITHFVLVNERSNKARWRQHVGLGDEEKEMRLVQGELSTRDWKNTRDLLDYNNHEGGGAVMRHRDGWDKEYIQEVPEVYFNFGS
ncbi:hypothetical protein C8A00DRAFT_36356 [Chaetomidium leptoderma]|uniref:Uncharacterized protein n=1 Tax=Chaetomidium leptoderma TaxID=669021 RepID=A0AAN6ZT75_9PEZI|nr:hypothetical protein C8A00DRAFT_36356 [Chaetomidium leptoderma]